MVLKVAPAFGTKISLLMSSRSNMTFYTIALLRTKTASCKFIYPRFRNPDGSLVHGFGCAPAFATKISLKVKQDVLYDCIAKNKNSELQIDLSPLPTLEPDGSLVHGFGSAPVLAAVHDAALVPGYLSAPLETFERYEPLVRQAEPPHHPSVEEGVHPRVAPHQEVGDPLGRCWDGHVAVQEDHHGVRQPADEEDHEQQDQLLGQTDLVPADHQAGLAPSRRLPPLVEIIGREGPLLDVADVQPAPPDDVESHGIVGRQDQGGGDHPAQEEDEDVDPVPEVVVDVGAVAQDRVEPHCAHLYERREHYEYQSQQGLSQGGHSYTEVAAKSAVAVLWPGYTEVPVPGDQRQRGDRPSQGPKRHIRQKGAPKVSKRPPSVPQREGVKRDQDHRRDQVADR